MSWAKLLTLQRHSACHQVIVSFTVAYTEKEVTGIKIFFFFNRGQSYCSALSYVQLHLFGTFRYGRCSALFRPARVVPTPSGR